MSVLNSAALDSRRLAKTRPILCYVTNRLGWPALGEAARNERLLERMEALSSAGVHWIQLREKDLSARACADLTRAVLRRLAPSSAAGKAAPRVLVNDRLDVALSERAGGVHLGEQSLPLAEARRLLLANSNASPISHDFLVGGSCHSLDAAKTAAADQADYIFFGPVFTTPAKAGYGPPQGLERLREICRSVSIPVLAIGGITLENAGSCFSVGASGIAAIRLFQDAPDPANVIRSLLALEGRFNGGTPRR
ncbi:MAG TPA: thiamine phosphate synthase [Candidatus Acidoferrum sp.]|nr:thiamine phosphate synthase [Candidatus Acidoferrum sp.]